MSTGPATLPLLSTKLENCRMVIIGVDPHKDVLVAVAVDGNGRQLALRDAPARPRGYETLLAWAAQFEQRMWAVEDVRYVAGGFVRFLLAAGEPVVWVPTQMSADYRKKVRASGKSNPIDPRALAEDLPAAMPDTETRNVKMLLDHREDLVGEMVRMCSRLRWHLHDIDPDFAATIPKHNCTVRNGTGVSRSSSPARSAASR